jgi:23S rRNA G2445 N2-methylase RlmL
VSPYYEKDGIVIYHGDCREVLPKLETEDAMVVVDPPYGHGRTRKLQTMIQPTCESGSSTPFHRVQWLYSERGR